MLIEAEDADFETLCAKDEARGYRVAADGFASPETLAMLREVAQEVRAEIAPAAWLIVEAGEIVGMVTLKNAPDEAGRVEIGYGVAGSHHRRGIAGRAVAGVLAWARAHPQIWAVTAETAEDNLASQRVLARNGFVPCGRRSDEEDGDLLLWEAPTESAGTGYAMPNQRLSAPAGS